MVSELVATRLGSEEWGDQGTGMLGNSTPKRLDAMIRLVLVSMDHIGASLLPSVDAVHAKSSLTSVLTADIANRPPAVITVVPARLSVQDCQQSTSEPPDHSDRDAK
jgi:hypothetical protein